MNSQNTQKILISSWKQCWENSPKVCLNPAPASSRLSASTFEYNAHISKTNQCITKSPPYIIFFFSDTTIVCTPQYGRKDLSLLPLHCDNKQESEMIMQQGLYLYKFNIYTFKKLVNHNNHIIKMNFSLPFDSNYKQVHLNTVIIM